MTEKEPLLLRDKLIADLRENPNLTPQELQKKHGANLSYCYAVKEKWVKNKKPFEPEKTETRESPAEASATAEQTPTPSSLSVNVKEVIKPEIPNVTEEKTGQLPEGIKKAILEGELSQEDITYVFQGINQLFPEKHQRPDKAMIILGKLWYRPANKILEEYSDKNPLLVIAVLMTVVTFAPSMKGMFEEWRNSKRQSPVKPEKSEKKSD